MIFFLFLFILTNSEPSDKYLLISCQSYFSDNYDKICPFLTNLLPFITRYSVVSPNSLLGTHLNYWIENRGWREFAVAGATTTKAGTKIFLKRYNITLMLWLLVFYWFLVEVSASFLIELNNYIIFPTYACINLR